MSVQCVGYWGLWVVSGGWICMYGAQAMGKWEVTLSSTPLKLHFAVTVEPGLINYKGPQKVLCYIQTSL